MKFDKQKMLSGVLATGLALSCLAGPVFAAGIKDKLDTGVAQIEQQEKAMDQFTDIDSSHWAYSFAARMVQDGLFAGTSATTFSPNAPMTESQFLTVVLRKAYPEELNQYNAEFGSQGWFMGAYQLGLDKGIISTNIYGTDTNAFNNRAITRERMTDMVIKAMESKGEVIGSDMSGAIIRVPDLNKCSDLFKMSVSKAYKVGILTGDNNGNMNPQKTATRVEGATVLYRFAYPDARKAPDFSKPPVVGPYYGYIQGEEQTWKEGEKHRKPRAGDTVIKADGTKVVIKYVEVAPGSNFFVLGYGQGVDIITGTTENGITLTEGRLGGAWQTFQPAGDLSPFVKDPITGEVHTEYEWGQISTHNFPTHKGTYEGEKAGSGFVSSYFVWDTVIEDWLWTGPTRAAYQ